MKKYIITVAVVIFAAIINTMYAYAGVQATETQLFVSADVENAVSKWFKIPEQNVGVGVTVVSGSCKPEITA